MQPSARRKSHRGTMRSRGPCSASNNQRVAEESRCMSVVDYIVEQRRFLNEVRVTPCILVLQLADHAQEHSAPGPYIHVTVFRRQRDLSDWIGSTVMNYG